ncbi:hypothetical protein GCM10027347_56450 [Larkinella harenae]
MLGAWLVLSITVPSQAQIPEYENPVPIGSVVDTVSFDLRATIAEQLLPFDSLVRIATQYSPLMRLEDAAIDSKEAQYRYSKTTFLQYVYPFVNYATGNQALISSGSLQSDVVQLANGYRAGFNFQIPISELFGRRQRIRETQANYRVALAQRDATRQRIKRELIVVYQGLLTAQRKLQARMREEQVALVAYRVAEVDLQKGKIAPAELARISSFYGTAQSYVEEERGDFLRNFYDLEALVGVPLLQLKK